MEVCTEGTALGTRSAAGGPAAATTTIEEDQTISTLEQYRVVHGAMMLLAWGLLIPLAVGEAARKLGDKWYDAKIVHTAARLALSSAART